MSLGLLKASTPQTVDGQTISEIEFDAIKVEQHRSRATTTRHPIESGAVITDHVIIEPEGLTLEAVFSNGPLTREGQQSPEFKRVRQGGGESLEYVSDGTEDPSRAQGLFDFVYQAHRAKALMTVVTSLREYTDLIITSVDTPRTAATGDGVVTTLTFEKVQTVDSLTGELPPPRTSPARANVSRGKKPGTDVSSDGPDQNQSLAASGADVLSGFFP